MTINNKMSEKEFGSFSEIIFQLITTDEDTSDIEKKYLGPKCNTVRALNDLFSVI